MKKKAIGSVLAAAALSLSLLAGCGASAPASSDAPAATAAPASSDYKWDFAKKNGSIDDLKQPCDEQGKVVERRQRLAGIG